MWEHGGNDLADAGVFGKFVDGLMPCLEKASSEGQEARVMTVLAPGTGSPLDPNDLGLKKDFSLMRAARQAPTYNDIMVKVSNLPPSHSSSSSHSLN